MTDRKTEEERELRSGQLLLLVDDPEFHGQHTVRAIERIAILVLLALIAGSTYFVSTYFGDEALEYALYAWGAAIVGGVIAFRLVKGYWPLQR